MILTVATLHHMEFTNPALAALLHSPTFVVVIMSKSTKNQAKPWTESDLAELQAFVAEEMSVEEMADELGRTVEAIRAKASKEGIELSARKADSESDE
jgi:hypothetical protein